ncbi:type VI secretion system baseplate subunit TssF [Mucilaginibacter glaciei]|uniref:Type VI secretion system baseplate subunit TssF n=1 Tax=Mucilaginibacter glaciei TaxID=2772109 RepID=A0A926NI19_9SPHI|nr:type VI secretion system baseplate subunit TssF [Mucilaginibacter glaciei]MBD1391641.1 type VI secretion system baseplate subunit TssF [Mucilaginibacter glaciei]
MNTIFFNSKEDIRTRMLRNAMDYWGTTNINDIDPMVKLLIEALSTELFNVSNDVKNLENRVLSKISRILASDYLTSALPAHAVLKAQPIEAKETVNINNHFIYKRPATKENSKAEELQVFFSPAGELELFNATIHYTASGRNVYENDEAMHKNTVLTARSNLNNEPGTLWLGIDCAPALNNLQNLTLFFEWPEYTANNDFYQLLSVVKLYIGNTELQTQAGLIYKEDTEQGIRPVFYEQNVINLITRDINDYYTTRFISLTDASLIDISNHKQAFPEEFAAQFNANELSQLKPCVWLKLTFPAAISAAVLDELQVSLNCFPVVNRRRHEQKYRLREVNNIIPIKVSANDHFLSVKELYDDRSVYYSEIPYTQATQSFEGSYTIRNGGAERFDPRNAQQLIEYLFELLRDEKAAFASYGSDFLNNILKTLEQNLALIEKKSKLAETGSELNNYLIVKPGAKASMLYLQYWTTLADNANHIRRGSRLVQFENIKIKADSLRLMTGTLGGRNSLGATERIQAYKYGLTTKDRIVTQADLVSYCFYELGNKITNVKIGKGIMVSANPKEGFKKTVDIFLEPAANLQLAADDWDTLLTLLKSKLTSRSVMNANYRLFVSAN